MKRVDYPAAIRDIIAELKRLPGVGPRISYTPGTRVCKADTVEKR